jgi:hypothetical protein
MPSLRVNGGQPVHKAWKVTLSWRSHNQVPVIGHGTICQQFNGVSLQRLPQDRFKLSVRLIAVEQRVLPNCSIQNMMWQFAKDRARMSSHRAEFEAQR